MTVILCVEDESDIREDIVEELQDAGYQTLEAENGAKGLEVITKYKPDLVLCDITMPKMDGFSLLKKLRSEFHELSGLPFIFLSALADRHNMIKGKTIGADDYITKPIDYELLLATVKARIDHTERLKSEREKELVKLYTAISSNKADQSSRTHDGALSENEDAADFVDEFSDMARRNSGAVVTSKFQVIRLDQIKKELGDKWPKLSKKIFDIADQILRRRLMNEDIHKRQGSGYLVCFATLPEEEARFKAEAIAKEIEEKVLGEGVETKFLNIESQTTTINISEQNINDTDNLLSFVSDRLDQVLDRLEKQRQSSWNNIFDESGIIFQKVIGRGKGVLPILATCFDERTKNSIIRHKRLSKIPKELESEISILEMIRVVEHVADTISSADRKFIIGVDFATLTNKRFYEKYLAMCKKVDPTIRNLLIPRIRNIPENVSSSIISEIAMNLHSLFSLHMLQLDQPSFGSIDFLASQIRIISMDYNIFQQHMNTPFVLVNYIKQIHSNKARFIVENVEENTATTTLFEMGVDFVSLKA